MRAECSRFLSICWVSHLFVYWQLLKRLAAAAPPSSVSAPDGGGGCTGRASGGGSSSSGAQYAGAEAAVFSELSVQLDKAEDGLLAGAEKKERFLPRVPAAVTLSLFFSRCVAAVVGGKCDDVTATRHDIDRSVVSWDECCRFRGPKHKNQVFSG